MEASFDLIAVGAGLAGLAAALRARELGRRVLVLERSDARKNLCASRVNGGLFHVAFRSCMADPAELSRLVRDATHGFVEDEIARVIAGNAARTVHWLRAHGVEFTRMEPEQGWRDWVLAPLGFHDSTTMRWEGLGADRMMDRLEAQVAEQGATFLRGVRMTGLVMESGRCRGVRARGPEGECEYRAGAVVLADGGFHGNAEMLRRFVTPHPEHLKLRGTSSGQGDGIRAAEAVGARLVGMEAFYGHLLCADCLRRDNLSPFPFLEFLACVGVMVDANGERFVDEGRGGHVMANTLARRGDGIATVVFDDAMWNTAGRHFFCPPNPHLVEAGGTLHRANDIDTLARLAGLPAQALVHTIEAHNAALAAGRLDRLNPPRSPGKLPAAPFREPPYYASPACPAITHTMGGVAVDGHARVLARDGTPIPGLYAAGTTCGGQEGGPDAAYLGGLSKAVTFGLLAAETSAEAT